jgi:plasmid stabilization system protein ParE
MSAFEVRFTRRATAAFDEALDWYKARSIHAAGKWIDAVDLALDRLGKNPHRYPRAAEDGLLAATLHQYTFGAGRRLTHRMVYAIRPNLVMVYSIRHLAQGPLTIDDLIGPE